MGASGADFAGCGPGHRSSGSSSSGSSSAAAGQGPEGEEQKMQPQQQQQQQQKPQPLQQPQVQPAMVVSTYPGKAEASKAAAAMVESRLAACASISEISSFYWWDGEVVAGEREQIVMFKTTSSKCDALKDAISAAHPYDVPEIAEVHIRDINGPYLRWLESSTGLAGGGGNSSSGRNR